MIITIISENDPNVITHANTAIVAYGTDITGELYRAFESAIPILGEEENLYLVAHGTALHPRVCEAAIGNASNDFLITSHDLIYNLSYIFPKGWRGNIFVEACFSADQADNTHISFVDGVYISLYQIKGLDANVFGRTGKILVESLLPRPESHEWIRCNKNIPNPTPPIS